MLNINSYDDREGFDADGYNWAGHDKDGNSRGPDTALGHYYVTAIRDNRHAFLLGPFTNDHAAALSRVEEVRELANRLDPRSHFDAFGTAKLSIDLIGVPKGRLNSHMGL